MKGSSRSATVVLLVALTINSISAGSSGNEEENWPRATLIAHESDCTKFYVSFGGTKHPMQCAERDSEGNRLYFDSNVQGCVWPEDSNCVSTVADEPNQGDDESEAQPGLSGSSKEIESLDTESSHNAGGGNNPSGSGPRSDERSSESEPESTIPTECPADNEGEVVHIAHEDNCGMFYKCNHGEKVLFKCNEDLAFNPEIQRCDWPKNVEGCTDYAGSDDSDKSEDKPSDGNWSEESREDSAEEEIVIPTECPETNGDYAISIRNEHDCSTFYKCNHGQKVMISCPAGLEFNAVKQVCDWPDRAGCVAEVKDEPNGNDSDDSGHSGQGADSNENSGDSSDSGEPGAGHHEGSGPESGNDEGSGPESGNNEGSGPEDNDAEGHPGAGSNEHNEDSNGSVEHESGHNEDSGPDNETEIPTECPASNGDAVVLIAGEDCGSFYMCNHGEKVKKECPAGTEFNPKKQVCDWPENAGCIAKNSHESSSSESHDSGNSSQGSDSNDNSGDSSDSGEPDAGHHEGSGPESGNDQGSGPESGNHEGSGPEDNDAEGQPGAGSNEHNEDSNGSVEHESGHNGDSGSDNETEIPTECPASNGDDVVLIAGEDCGSFYMCNHGEKVKKQCPAGTEFNAKKQVCDWPENAGCIAKNADESSSSESHDSGNSSQGSDSNDNSGDSSDSGEPDAGHHEGSGPESGNDEGSGPESGNNEGSGPEDNDAEGHPGAGSNEHNEDSNGSVEHESENNEGSGPEDNGAEGHPDSGSNDHNGDSNGSVEHESGHNEDSGSENESEIPTECPATNGDDLVLIPAEVCDSFYMCNHGEKTIMRCPEGLQFNARKQVCDWPHNVECSANSSGHEDSSKPSK